MSTKASWKWDWTDCGVGSATDEASGVTFWVTAAGWIQPAGLVTLLPPEEIQRLADDLRQALRDRPPPAFEDRGAHEPHSNPVSKDALASTRAAGSAQRSRRGTKTSPHGRPKKDFSAFDFSV